MNVKISGTIKARYSARLLTHAATLTTLTLTNQNCNAHTFEKFGILSYSNAQSFGLMISIDMPKTFCTPTLTSKNSPNIFRPHLRALKLIFSHQILPISLKNVENCRSHLDYLSNDYLIGGESTIAFSC